MKKYNVLLLMTDQHRFDALGCYGNPVIETPNLDWMASEGTVFECAYTPSPSCIPARACLISGQDPWNTGILGMGRGQGPMGGGFVHTLPGELAGAGYLTRGIGKMHFAPQRLLNGFHHIELDESGRRESVTFESDYMQWFMNNRNGDCFFNDHGVGWNSWMARPSHLPEYLHPTNWTAARSVAFLRDHDPSMPYFLKTSFARPHSPYDPPQVFYDRYSEEIMPRPYLGDWAAMHDVPADAARPDAWRGRRSDIEIARARRGYYGSVTHIDSQIGRILNHMKGTGELRDTVVIFTSDHGDMLGDHHLWRKTYAYEGSAHIPLIVRLPDELRRSLPVKSRVDAPVTLQDILPTILVLCGVPVPKTVDGRSLLPLIRGDDSTRRDYVHGEHCECYSPEQEMQYLTDGKYKYVWLPNLGAEQLFDLKRDPGECRDLSKDAGHAGELRMWRERLKGIFAGRGIDIAEGDGLCCRAGLPPIVSPKYRERLQRWGFDMERFSGQGMHY